VIWFIGWSDEYSTNWLVGKIVVLARWQGWQGWLVGEGGSLVRVARWRGWIFML